MEAPPAIPATAREGEDAEDSKGAEVVDAGPQGTMGSEKSRDNADASASSEPAGDATTSQEASDAKLGATSGAKKQKTCCECSRSEGVDESDVVRVCTGCDLAVHISCYGDSAASNELLGWQQDGQKSSQSVNKEEVVPAITWKCDCCQRGASRLAVECIYCASVGLERAMRVVDTADTAASGTKLVNPAEGEATAASSEHEAVQYGHALCIKWDPRRLVPRDDTEKDSETKLTPAGDEAPAAPASLANAIANETLPPSACCFCHTTTGVRIQCRRMNCARFFHAMCAFQGDGLLEQRVFEDITQYHVYCDRHRDCAEDMVDVLQKLLERPIRQLIGRDDARRFTNLVKRLPTYHSVMTLLRDLTEMLVQFCNEGLRASKREPPEYNMKHLQVLQLFLDNVPQLEKVYALPPTPVSELVGDKKLVRRLEMTFDPPRYLATYPGPLSQQHVCAVCQAPFHQRQHLFYCTGEDGSTVLHMQHWRCTKRRSKAREREKVSGSSGGSKKKRKAITVVQDGVRKDVVLPKGLQSVTDDVICGVCRAPVDARGLLASRKEAKRADFEKKESSFVQSGCYVNKLGGKVANGFTFGPRLLPPLTSTAASSRKVSRSGDSRRSRRSHSNSTDRSRTNGSAAANHAAATPALAPLKMERVHVQRTTRWLACVGQIIRLAGSSMTAATVPSAVSAPTETPVSSAAPTPAAASPPSTAVAAVEEAAASTDDAMTVSTASTAGPLPSSEPGAAMTTTTEETDKREQQPGDGQSNATTSMEPDAPGPSSGQEDKSLVSDAMQAYFEEAMRIVRPYDAYALDKMETAREMLVHRSGPGVAVLRMLSHEYTRFIYIKHTRAAEKARAEKRKREEHEAQVHRERERKRIDREAERALKTQMLAMRNKQRQHLKHATS